MAWKCQKDFEGLSKNWEDLDKVDVLEPNNAFTLQRCADVKMMLED
jgi:hypothetical protein